MNCDLCDSVERTEIEPGIFVCMGCGFVYCPERRSASEIAEDWSNIYQSKAYDPNWPGAKARLWYVSEWLDQKFGLREKRILDIGAGNGNFLAYVKDRGAISVGLEPDEGNCVKIRDRGISAIQGCIEERPKWAGTYDLVTINWTLENCGDCLGMLKWAKERLAPKGKVVVSTGSRILVPFKKPYGRYFGHLSPDLHCFRWSFRTLEKALNKIGMKVIEANDWTDRDEMIVVAEPSPIPKQTFGDNPLEVVEFFREWKRQWP